MLDVSQIEIEKKMLQLLKRQKELQILSPSINFEAKADPKFYVIRRRRILF